MHDLIIVGAGGHGRETLDIVEAINAMDPSWAFVGFVDDRHEAPDQLKARGATLLGPTGLMQDNPAHYVIGIGSCELRAKLDAQITRWGRTAATLVHPLASIGADNRIGEGVLLAAGARVTTNVTLGRHVQLNVNAVVSHDCEVDDYCTLSPGVHVNGGVRVGHGVFVGTGAIVTPGVCIGDGAVIGAGAVVVDHVPAGVVVKGIPGRW